MTRTARVPAFAKLNLGLRVLYRRSDDYHELRTVFQTISLADRIEVSFTRARRTEIVVEGAPEISDNLAAKAALLALQVMRLQGIIRIELNKRIPMGAGLGGGSSNAAAILLALPVLAGRPVPLERLSQVAAELGSDVPFFLHGGSALGVGRGEELYPVPSPAPTRAVVVVPAIHSSTAEAYRNLSETLTSISLQNKLINFQRELWRWADAGRPEGRLTRNRMREGIPAAGIRIDDNDFESVVFARHPELKRIKMRLVRLGANPAAMSGSGSAIFGIFAVGRMEDSARFERATRSFSGDKVFQISFVSRAQYRSAWRRALKPHIDHDSWPPRSLYAQ